MTSRRLSFATVLSCTFALIALFVGPSPSEAQFRGGYGAMQRYAQQSAKYMQQQAQQYQQQQKEQHDAFMKRFDTNKNGKIDGKEKGPAQKYLRKLEMGQDPDKAVKSMGRTSSTLK